MFGRLYYLALKTLPDQFVADGTQVTVFQEMVIVIHPSYRPMCWREEWDKWREIEFINKGFVVI